MRLSEIVSYLKKSGANPVLKNVGGSDPDVAEVFCDSRRVKSGIFFCISGAESDGHKFAAAAQNAGAQVLCVERYVEDCSIPQIILGSTREWLGKVAAFVYGNPSDKLKMFAVTGTNGKTTTTWIIRSLLESFGMKCGIIGTIIQNDGLNEWDAERTTPESCDVQRLLAQMVKNGCRACVMETSSHGLFLGRLDGCTFNTMLFTNLNPEHLDFHKDMESYFAAKKLLFDRHAKQNSKIVVNSDDSYGKKIIESYSGVVSFGADGVFSARGLELGLDGSRFELHVGGKNFGIFSSPLVANFNVQNTLGAIAAVFDNEIDVDTLRRGVEKIPQVPGRLEKHFIEFNGGSACCIIDFAHTPEALKNVLSSVREFCKGELVSVFGHGGGRYQSNRSELGRTAAQIADKIIITMDNPRREDPKNIAEQIAAGIKEENPNKNMKIILNRSEAIKTAIDALRPGDVIVLSGKGPEKYLIVGDEKMSYSDAGEVEKIVRTGTYMPIPCRLVVDSREIFAGCGFVALVGEKTDGHLYIDKALAGGAAFVVGKRDKKPQNFPPHIPYIALDNTEKELAALARQHIDRLHKKCLKEIIAITGSVGKTTTREMVKRVLEKKYRVHAAERSFNTLIGCAVSILACPEDTEILLLEFGANKGGEILELTEFFAPTVSIITEVAPVHLEGFKTLEGVLSGKMEITKSERLKTFIYNSDNELLKDAAGEISARLVPVGRTDGEKFSPQLWGEHFKLISAIAAAVGTELGVPAGDIADAINSYEAMPGRGRVARKNGRILIDDAYNANPASMTASLSAFVALDAKRKIAVLGDMRELGENSAKFHQELFALTNKIELVVFVGNIWRDAAACQEPSGLPSNSIYAENWEDADSFLQHHEWDALLVKGSNSHKLQKLVAAVEEKL